MNVVGDPLEEFYHVGILMPEPKYLFDGFDHLIHLQIFEFVFLEAGYFEGIVEFFLNKTAVGVDVDE